MTVCAYCKEDKPATREHVIPHFIYAFQKELAETVIGWNDVVHRMVGGEAKIKDVCAACNNETLAELDRYAQSLFLSSGLLVPNFRQSTLLLKYDHGILLRWLLKVSFNSARVTNIHASPFAEHLAFMRGLQPAPPRFRIACLLGLAAPEQRGQSRIDDEAFERVAPEVQTINPFVVRICNAQISGGLDYVLRVNIFGPAVFYLMLFHTRTLPGHAAAAIRQLQRAEPGIVELTPRRRLVEIHPGRKTWLDLWEQQMARVQAFSESADLSASDWVKAKLRNSSEGA